MIAPSLLEYQREKHAKCTCTNCANVDQLYFFRFETNRRPLSRKLALENVSDAVQAFRSPPWNVSQPLHHQPQTLTFSLANTVL